MKTSLTSLFIFSLNVVNSLAQNLAPQLSSSSTGGKPVDTKEELITLGIVAGSVFASICLFVFTCRFALRRCDAASQRRAEEKAIKEGTDGRELPQVVVQGETTTLLPANHSSLWKPQTKGLCPKTTGTACGDAKDAAKEAVFGGCLLMIGGGA